MKNLFKRIFTTIVYIMPLVSLKAMEDREKILYETAARSAQKYVEYKNKATFMEDFGLPIYLFSTLTAVPLVPVLYHDIKWHRKEAKYRQATSTHLEAALKYTKKYTNLHNQKNDEDIYSKLNEALISCTFLDNEISINGSPEINKAIFKGSHGHIPDFASLCIISGITV